MKWPVNLADGTSVKAGDTIYEVFANRIVARLVLGPCDSKWGDLIECAPLSREAMCVRPSGAYGSMTTAIRRQIIVLERNVIAHVKQAAAKRQLIAQRKAELKAMT